MSTFESRNLIAFVSGQSTIEGAIRQKAIDDPQLDAKLRLMGAVSGVELPPAIASTSPLEAKASESDPVLPFVSGVDESSNIFDSGLRHDQREFGRAALSRSAAAFERPSALDSRANSDASSSLGDSPVSDEDSAFQSAPARLSEGSEEAAWDLIQEYGPHIERVVRRRLDQRLRSKFDSQDFVQMVWASFFRHRSRINQFTNPKELVRHLAALAKNKVIDAARRGQTQKHAWNRERDFCTESGREPSMDGGNPTPSQYAMARECWNRMMSSESERNQQIVKMRIAGQTFAEIGDQLGLHERTVRRVIERLISKEDGPQVSMDP